MTGDGDVAMAVKAMKAGKKFSSFKRDMPQKPCPCELTVLPWIFVSMPPQ